MILPDILASASWSGLPVLFLDTHALPLVRIAGSRADSLLLLIIGTLLVLSSFLVRALLHVLSPRRALGESKAKSLPGRFAEADPAAGAND